MISIKDISNRQSLPSLQGTTHFNTAETKLKKNHNGAGPLHPCYGKRKVSKGGRAMYADWPQFESFCARIAVTPTESPELESALHQFRCCWEALLGQVRMRAALVNVFPVQFRGIDNSLPATAFGDNARAVHRQSIYSRTKRHPGPPHVSGVIPESLNGNTNFVMLFHPDNKKLASTYMWIVICAGGFIYFLAT